MNETNITRYILLALMKHLPHVRMFRNNVGTGWQGESFRKGDVLIIKNPRPLQAGLCEGSSDLIGWTPVVITPDMVGKKVAVFTALEVKVPGGKGPTKEQENFLQRVKQAGGIAATVRSDEDALNAFK